MADGNLAGVLGRVRRSGGPSRGRLPVPVRVRVTLVAALIVALALVAGGWLFLRAARVEQRRDIEHVVRERIADVVDLVQRGAATGRLPGARDSSLLVQVLDRDGKVVAATTNVSDMNAISKEPAVPGKTIRRTTTVDAARCLLYTTGVTVGGQTFAVHVAAPLGSMDHSMAMLRNQLWQMSPLVLLAGVAALWVVVGRALRPVDVLRREVDAISALDLHRRVTPPPVADEVGRLAITMNALLDRLQRSSERQTRFVSDASHELRSPLAFVRTKLEVAMRHPARTDWHATANEVLRESRRMERLVADLLLLTRTDGVKALRDPKPVDLDEVLLEELRAVKTAVEKASTLRIDARGVSAGRVLGDGDQLRRVVANLLDNAVRHSQSVVELRLVVVQRPNGSIVSLAVADDGPGVPPGERERIFERFARLDESRARGTGGAGLGLAIVREIVAVHGGQVWVEDRSTGGARFVVELPAVELPTDSLSNVSALDSHTIELPAARRRASTRGER